MRTWIAIAALALSCAACGPDPARSAAVTPTPMGATATIQVYAESEVLSERDLIACFANDPRCRCLFAADDLAAPPALRQGQLELRLNPSTVLHMCFPSSGGESLCISAVKLLVAFDTSGGRPKVRGLRLLGAPAAIRDADGAAMVVSPRIALGIGEGGIMSVDIDPQGVISRIPGT